MYHKVFAHLLVCFWRELRYGGEFFANKKKSTFPMLLYPFPVNDAYPLEHWARLSVSGFCRAKVEQVNELQRLAKDYSLNWVSPFNTQLLMCLELSTSHQEGDFLVRRTAA